MKLKYYIIFLVLVALSYKGNAIGESNESKEHTESQIRVSGKVIDSKTGEALAGVKVTLTDVDKEVYTNFEGEFEFTNLSPGKYSLKCNMITYEQFNLSEVKLESIKGQNALILHMNPVSIKFRPKQKYEPITCG